MNTEAVQMFSALLAVAAIGWSLLLVWAIFMGSKGETGRAVLQVARDNAMRLSLLLAGASMVGSLYFSEVAHYAPCKLCWYQRVCMYSVAVISLVAVIRRERSAAPYVLTLSLVGLVVSTYHYVVEWFPQLESRVCAVDVPCTTIWFRELGFLTMPSMAGIAFIAIILTMVAERKS
jgi:disulfide bond formation protein DsbB